MLGHAELCCGSADPKREIEFLLRKSSFRSQESRCETGRLRAEVFSEQRIKRRGNAVPAKVTQRLRGVDASLRRG